MCADYLSAAIGQAHRLPGPPLSARPPVLRDPRLVAVLSFALMLAASAWVLRGAWPAEGSLALPIAAHVVAALVTAFEMTTRALKIRFSARAIGTPLGFGSAFRTCLAGDFAAAVTPARSGAEPARYAVLAESGVAVGARLVILFLELLLELVSLVIVCGALAWLFHGRGASAVGLLGLVTGYATGVLGFGVVALGLARRNAAGPPPAWARRLGLHAGRWRRVQRVVRHVRDGVRALRTARPGPMLAALTASVAHVVGKVAVLPALVFVADPGFTFTQERLAPLVLWPLALFYGGVVVPAPGGGGVVEGAFAYVLRDAIPVPLFAASLLWWRVYTFYAYLAVGALAAGDTLRRALLARAPRDGDAPLTSG